MLCNGLPEAWLSWGAFCDSRARQDGPLWTQHAVSAYLQVSIWCGSLQTDVIVPLVLVGLLCCFVFLALFVPRALLR